MDFEQFREFMWQSAAKHDAEIGKTQQGLARVHDTMVIVGESLRSLHNTVEHLVENQIHLQESMDEQHRATQESIRETQESIRETQDKIRQTQDEIREVGRVVFGHVMDRDAHTRLQR